MSKRLYVGNLPFTLTGEELSTAFEQWGPVESAAIIMDHATGQSKGFGFVQLPDEKADEAMTQMNGALFHGRPLKVNEARPREARPPAGSYRAAEGWRGAEKSESSGAYPPRGDDGVGRDGFPRDTGGRDSARDGGWREGGFRGGQGGPHSGGGHHGGTRRGREGSREGGRDAGRNRDRDRDRDRDKNRDWSRDWDNDQE